MRCRYWKRKDTQSVRYVVYLDHGGHRWTRTYYDENLSICSQEMADRLCHEINGAIEREKKAFDPRRWFKIKLNELRFTNYARTWLNRKDLQPGSYNIYTRVITETSRVMGNLDIREIRKAHIVEYQESLKSLATNTIKHRLDVLHILFSDAFQNEDIDRIPGWPKVKTTAPETVSLCREEQQLILSHIPAHDQPIFRFMMAYGLRVSEAIALMWDCVLWQRHQVIIKRTISGNTVREVRKAGDRLPLPMTDEIEAILRPLRGFRGFVFLNRVGHRYQRQGLLRACYTACEKAGVQRVGLHELCRHSKGGQLADQEFPLELIAALLGHSSTQHTRRYAPLRTRRLRGMVG